MKPYQKIVLLVLGLVLVGVVGYVAYSKKVFSKDTANLPKPPTTNPANKAVEIANSIKKAVIPKSLAVQEYYAMLPADNSPYTITKTDLTNYQKSNYMSATNAGWAGFASSQIMNYYGSVIQLASSIAFTAVTFGAGGALTAFQIAALSATATLQVKQSIELALAMSGMDMSNYMNGLGKKIAETVNAVAMAIANVAVSPNPSSIFSLGITVGTQVIKFIPKK